MVVGMATTVIVTSNTGGFERDRPRCQHVSFMSAHHINEPEDAIEFVDAEEAVGAELVGPEEMVDGVPVLAEVRAIEPAWIASLPAVQAAAVAATGFVAGAAMLALMRRHSARKIARARLRSRRGIEGLPIVGSRSFLVDVHLIAKPGE
jgi:hypothetical protein